MLETSYEVMRRQGITRRSFLKFCSLTAASLGLGEAGAQQIQKALETKPRTPVVWLHGLESHNRNSFARHIYIHGTPEERNIGLPVSYGCVRMRSSDVIELYDRVGNGARVDIFREPLAQRLPKLFPPTATPPASPMPEPPVVAGQLPESPRPL